MSVWPISSSIESSVRCARFSAEVKATSKRSPCALSLLPGGARLGDALLGQVDVAPAGEQVLQVPFALAVAHEHEKPVTSFARSLIDRHCRAIGFKNPAARARRPSNRGPASCPRAHSAAFSAPRAKIMRSSALVRRARCARPGRRRSRVCSPTTVPPRSVAKPMSPGLRAPVMPSRPRTERCAEIDAAALARPRGRASARCRTARRPSCCDAFPGSRCRNPRRASAPRA